MGLSRFRDRRRI